MIHPFRPGRLSTLMLQACVWFCLILHVFVYEYISTLFSLALLKIGNTAVDTGKSLVGTKEKVPGNTGYIDAYANV